VFLGVGSLDQAVSEEKIFRDRPIRKQNVCGGHVCLRIGTKSAFFIENLPVIEMMLANQSLHRKDALFFYFFIIFFYLSI
jgi:hypothetical protein